MDQLHRAHDNGRAANAPVQTRNLTEHRERPGLTTCRIGGMQPANKGEGSQGPVLFERIFGR